MVVSNLIVSYYKQVAREIIEQRVQSRVEGKYVAGLLDLHLLFIEIQQNQRIHKRVTIKDEKLSIIDLIQKNYEYI